MVGQFTWTPWSRRTLSIRALPTVDRRKGPVAAQSGPSGGPVEVPQRANRRPSDSSGSRKGPVGAQYQPHGSSSQVKKEVHEMSWRGSSEAQYEPEAQEGSKGSPPDVQQASNRSPKQIQSESYENPIELREGSTGGPAEAQQKSNKRCNKGPVEIPQKSMQM